MGTAGIFIGTVEVLGTLFKDGGGFKIDHPLDPSNKYLFHSFVESPEMKNVYDGTTALDRKGEAIVKLPDWFEALNSDFRYQLTAIGGPAPNLHIAKEVRDNRFTIAGGLPGGKVAWQVTGIRKDAWAERNRITPEVTKRGKEKGRFLHPELHGKTIKESTMAGRFPKQVERWVESKTKDPTELVGLKLPHIPEPARKKKNQK